MKYIFNIILFFIAISSSLVEAKPFAINNPQLFDSRDIEIWNKVYADIKNQDDLNSLLKTISDKYQLKYIEAYNAKKVIRIKVEKATLIEKFDIKMTISEYIQDVQSLLAYLILKVDSQNTDKIIKNRVKTFLTTKGYYNSDIRIVKDYSKDKASIRIIIDENNPCLVREVKYKLKLLMVLLQILKQEIFAIEMK